MPKRGQDSRAVDTAITPTRGVLFDMDQRSESETKFRPYPGRQTSSRVRTQQDATRTTTRSQQVSPPNHCRPACQVRRSRASRDLVRGTHVHTASAAARSSASRWTSVTLSTASQLMRP
jgi:hypothetical protein